MPVSSDGAPLSLGPSLALTLALALGCPRRPPHTHPHTLRGSHALARPPRIRRLPAWPGSRAGRMQNRGGGRRQNRGGGGNPDSPCQPESPAGPAPAFVSRCWCGVTVTWRFRHGVFRAPRQGQAALRPAASRPGAAHCFQGPPVCPALDHPRSTVRLLPAGPKSVVLTPCSPLNADTQSLRRTHQQNTLPRSPLVTGSG